MRVISHDAFARETLVRHTFKCLTESCAWCGGKNARGWLHSYEIVADDSGKHRRIDGYFCSIGCMRAFHA